MVMPQGRGKPVYSPNLARSQLTPSCDSLSEHERRRPERGLQAPRLTLRGNECETLLCKTVDYSMNSVTPSLGGVRWSHDRHGLFGKSIDRKPIRKRRMKDEDVRMDRLHLKIPSLQPCPLIILGLSLVILRKWHACKISNLYKLILQNQ